MGREIKHINVLDAPAKGVGQGEVTYLTVLIVFMVVGVACGGYSLWKLRQIHAEEASLTQISAEVTRLSAQVEPKHQKVSGQDVLKKLNYPILWSGILKKTLRLVPDSLQISQLTASIVGTRTLSFTINTDNKNLITLLGTDLSQIPECKEVRIASVNELSFRLECVLP
jgi:phage-related holin